VAGTSGVTLFRIGTDAPGYQAHDLSGTGARIAGARWNRAGTAVLYAATSRALACLETVVHTTPTDRLPLNRYLVEIDVPPNAWAARAVFDPAANVGWDAEPPGQVSLDWGTSWAQGGASLLAEVPSVIVPEESNVLVNPAHRDLPRLIARKVRRWLYDPRLF
jgi:RES domain-containing protein